jgi:hypothetical protein
MRPLPCRFKSTGKAEAVFLLANLTLSKMSNANKDGNKTSSKRKIVRKVFAPAREAVTVDLQAEEPKVRYLKMRAFFRESSWGFFDQSPPEILPVLQLKENCLEDAGFSPDGYVSVTALKGLLIIRVCEK